MYVLPLNVVTALVLYSKFETGEKKHISFPLLHSSLSMSVTIPIGSLYTSSFFKHDSSPPQSCLQPIYFSWLIDGKMPSHAGDQMEAMACIFTGGRCILFL